MDCQVCGTDNPASHRFCRGCGTSLTRNCPSCGTGCAADDRFCGGCGAALAVPATTDVDVTPPASPGDVPDAERRSVTILFVDLVDFTPLAERSDPEAVRDLQSDYFEHARVIVDRYGGVVEKFIGDAVMAVWGTPIAHEDDAERAVRAALDLLDVVSAIGDTGGDEPGLRARAGIATGEAAVRLAAAGQGMVTGDVVNIAARVQSVAEPARVLVDDATRAASSNAIAYAAAGEHQLKGRTEPTRVFVAEQVVAGSRGSQRPDGLEAPFMGRDRDLRLLKELFHGTVDGSRARLVLVSGAAGVGKSRLGWEFFKYLDGIVLTTFWHVGRCLAYGEGVAYWALADMMRMRLRISEGDSDEVVAARLDEGLVQYVDDAEERDWLRPRLAVLLGVGESVVAGADELTRDSLFAGWRRFLEHLAERAPVVLLFEDLQSADSGLLDFIDHLLEWSAERPIFIAGLTRPEFLELRPEWSGHQRNITVLHLDLLPGETIERMIDALVKGLPPATRAELAARSEGVPLFAVETVRMLIDRDIVVPRDGEYVLAQDIDEVAALELPPTLQALVAARLDNLPEDERRLVKDVSVLGLSFTPAAAAGLMREVGGLTDDRVEDLLASLARKGVLSIRSDARSPEAGQYRFVQKTMRSVAYGTLSRRDRKQRHLAAATNLEATHDADDVPGIIATHYLEAADAVPDDADADQLRATAVRHLERAGERARTLAASDEAERYFERAFALSSSDADRVRLAELAGLMAYRNGRSARALERYAIAHAIHEDSGDLRSLARVASLEGDALTDLDRAAEGLELMVGVHHELGGEVLDAESAQLANSIATAHVGLNDFESARPWLEQASSAAEAAGAWEILARSLNVRGVLLMTLDDRPVEGLALLRASLDLAEQHDMPARASLQCGNLALQFLAQDHDQAERYALDAVRHARRVGDRFSLAFAGSSLALVRLAQGRWDEIDEEALRRELRGASVFTRYGVLLPLTALAVWRGDEDALATLDAGEDEEVEDPLVRELQLTVRLLLAVHRGNLEDAVAAGQEVLELVGARGFDAGSFSWALYLSAAMELGRVDLVRDSVDAVAARPAGLLVPQLRAFLRWFQGRLAALDGDHDRAREHFDAAEELLRELGAVFWLARVQSDHAVWVAQRGLDRRARELATEAIEVFTALGASPFIPPVQRVIDALDGSERAAAARSGPSGAPV